MNRRWRRSIAFLLIWTMLSGVWGLPFGRVYAEGEAEPVEEVLISARSVEEGLHTSFETENFFEEKGDLSLQAEEEKVAEYSIEKWYSSENRWNKVGEGYNRNPYFKVYVEEKDGDRRAYCYLPKSIYEQQPVSAGNVYERDYTYEWVEPDPEGAPLTTGTAIALDHPYDKGSGDYAYYRHEVCKVEIPMAEGDLPQQLHLHCKSKGQENGYPASSDTVWRLTKSGEKEGTQRNKLSAPVAISSTGSFINTAKLEGGDIYQQGYGNNLEIQVYSPDMNEEPFCQSIDIRYTLDGTEPTAESPKIRRNQPPSETLSEKINYSTNITYTKDASDVQNAPERLPYDWKKGGRHVLKLKAFAPGLEASDTVTQEFELEKFPEHDLSQSRLLGCRTVVANLKDGIKADIYYDSKIALRQETEGRIYEVAREFCNSRSESRFLPITLEVTNPEGYVLKPLNKSSRQLFFTLKNLRQGDLSLLELSEDKLEAYEIKDDGSIEKLEYPQGFNVQDVFGIKSLMFSVIPEDEQGQGVDPAVEKIVRHYIVVEKGSDNSVLSLEELKKKAKETVSYAKNLPQEVLEEESRQKIKDKTAVLQSALKDEAVTQERLLKELESLQEAILRLKAKEQEYGDAKALREKLKTLIEDSKGNKVRGFKNVAYLQYMFDPVVKQIEEGAYSNPEATAEELQQAIDTLQSAINSLPEVDEFAKQPDDLEDGIYKVPVQLRNFGDEGQPSMGNAAIGKTGYLFVENGKQRLRVQFVPLYVLGMWGHLIDAWYYNPEQEIVKPEDVSLLGERHHIIPVEKKNGIGLDMKPYDFLTIVDIPIEKFTESPRRYVSVSVDAMNLIFSGKPYSNDPKDLKDAVFAIDYNQITKLNDASEIVWEDEMKQDQTEGELDKRLNALIEKTNKAIKGSYPADKTEALKKMLEAAQNLAVNPSATNEQKEEMCESLEALLKEIGFEDNKPTPPGGGSYGYDVDTEATGEELPQGKRYEVPVTLWHYYQDQPSMGNEAMEGMATVVEKDGKATYRITFKGLKMPFGGKEFYGHLTQFFVYDDQASSSDMNSAKKATLIETMEDIGLDGNTHTFPRIYQFTRGSLREKEIYVKVNVDAMTQIGKEMGQEGMGIQNAILRLNWDAVKDTSAGGSIGSYDSETDKTGIQIQVLGSESLEEGVKMQAKQLTANDKAYQNLQQTLNKFAQKLEEGSVKGANKGQWKGASVSKFVAYDINLKKGEENYELKDGKQVLLKLPIPKDFDAEKLALLHVGDKGELELLQGKVNAGMYEAAVEHFSTYVLAQVEQAEPIAIRAKNKVYRAYVSGYEDNTFKPDAKITRAEAAYLLAKAVFGEEELSGADTASKFVDTQAGAWYAKALNLMVEKGILKGYQGNLFKPDQAVSRAEFIAMAVKALQVREGSLEVREFKDLKQNHWAYGVIKTALSNGYVKGYEDTTFKPDANITRAEAVTMTNAFTQRPVSAEELKGVSKNFQDVSESHWAYWNIVSATNDIAINPTPNPAPELKKEEAGKKKEQKTELEDGFYQVPAEMMKAIGRTRPKDHSMSNNAIDHKVLIEVQGDKTFLYLTMRGMVIKAFGDKKGHLRQAWYYPSVEEYYRSLEEKKDLSKAVEVLNTYKETAFESDDIKEFPKTIKFPIERRAEFVYIKVEVDAMTAIGGVGSPDAAMKLDWSKIEKYSGELPK